ncbi:(2Fe-2S)-binding protein [Histidinibacterium aquaticum]|uniref:(2Fe-2S)-binding protein n=1 Tax=Histidinibacterium aquaticum TaxID=2613962 RepID=A0A5J5GEX3_9RHOB|nr:(2Fe-2S)-binding protein [Histidinibacterium aquaticum]KAA9006779.1 (2Fe-2S)-binding protein [Histidinibacterium aquaticum]
MDGETTCTINGEQRRFSAEEGTSLLLVLREQLGLRSARLGCGEESCGACTVLVDGEPVFSCTLPAEDIEGKTVTTAESLAGPEGDHPLLTAFLEHQAGQCGYCLPGILMRARAYLDSDAPVSREGIAAALDPSLCRCGAHQRMLNAVLDAAEQMGRA